LWKTKIENQNNEKTAFIGDGKEKEEKKTKIATQVRWLAMFLGKIDRVVARCSLL
jgi:hypothetical protein